MFGRAIADRGPSPLRATSSSRACGSCRRTSRSIDPAAKRVETDAGTFDADILVVALGADLDPAATPGLVEGGHEFYTEDGAFALRDVLASFDGGRVIVARHLDAVQVPAGAERDRAPDARLPHRARGSRDRSEIALVMPLPVPIPPSPDASEALLAAFAERGIALASRAPSCASLDPAREVALLGDGSRDALRPVPRRARSTAFRRSSSESGLTVDGWIPVDSAHARDLVPRRVRRRRRDQRRHPEGRRVRRRPGGGRRRADRRTRPRRRAIGPIRRPWHLLPRVRPR